MKKYILLSILLILMYSCSSPELNSEQIFKKVNDAVVTVYAKDYKGNVISQGSGVVLNDYGWIVTNYHVYGKMGDSLLIKHNGKTIGSNKIMIIGYNKDKDLLILKIPEHIFPSISLNITDSLNIGQKIYAIGSPMGFENTITDGIISGLRNNDEKTKKYIQISTAISHGSSGGAIVNSRGELIGISSLSVVEGQNLNFAIPINEVEKIYTKEGGNNKNDIIALENIYQAQQVVDINKRIELCKKAIAMDPKFENAYKYLGFGFRHKSNIEKSEIEKTNYKNYAISSFKKAIELNPIDPEIYNTIGNIYLSNYKSYYPYKKQQLVEDSVIYYFNKAIDIDSTDYEGYNNIAFIYEERKDYEISIKFYKKSIEQESMDPEENNEYYYDSEGSIKQYSVPYFWLTQNYNSIGRIYDAIDFLRKVVDTNPKNAIAYCYIGYAYYMNKDYDTAIYYIKKSIAINPNYIDAYNFLSWCYNKEGDIQHYNLVEQKRVELINKDTSK